MKIKLCFCIILFFHSISIFYAQNNDHENVFSDSNKTNNTTLCTGFYKVRYYNGEPGKNFRVQYTQHVENIELQQSGFLAKRKVKSSYVYSTANVIDLDNELIKKYIRKLKSNNYDQEYVINPIPIASKENVIRIYNFKYYNYDSTVCCPGLTLKLNYCDDSDIKSDDLNNEKSTLIGLVVDNKLIAIAKDCIKEGLNSGNEKDVKYLLFIFINHSIGQVKAYEKELFNQTLIRK